MILHGRVTHETVTPTFAEVPEQRCGTILRRLRRQQHRSEDAFLGGLVAALLIFAAR
jgi:hypothetical protein